MVPLTNAVVTALVAGFGTAAVAGYGAATRVDALALVLSNGLSSSLGPLVGHNWGAGEVARIRRAAMMTCGAIFAVSVVVYGVLYVVLAASSVMKVVIWAAASTVTGAQVQTSSACFVVLTK